MNFDATTLIMSSSESTDIKLTAFIQDRKHSPSGTLQGIRIDPGYGSNYELHISNYEHWEQLCWKHNIEIIDRRLIKATESVAEESQHEMPYL
jgi:hypothetical protein